MQGDMEHKQRYITRKEKDDKNRKDRYKEGKPEGKMARNGNERDN